MGHCFVFALLICEDDSQDIVAVKPYLTKKFCKRTNRTFKTQNQLAVEILQELTIPPETHVTVVADSAFLVDFVVDKIRHHPTWSFVSSLDSNRKITVKRYTSHAIDFGRRRLPDLQTVFLHELKHDLTKFDGKKIVKSRIFQAVSAASSLFPLRIAS